MQSYSNACTHDATCIDKYYADQLIHIFFLVLCFTTYVTCIQTYDWIFCDIVVIS